MILSSIFSYIYKAKKDIVWGGGSHAQEMAVYKLMAISLRYAGNVLAAINTVIVLATGIFQFGSIFDNCYCDGSVLGRGAASAYNVVIPTGVGGIRSIWAGAIVVAVSSVGIFLIFVWLLIDDGPEVFNRQATHTCVACHGTGTLLPHDEDRSRLASQAISRQPSAQPEVDGSPEVGLMPPQTESIHLITLIPPIPPSVAKSMTDTYGGS
jgi:hypothetical protein